MSMENVPNNTSSSKLGGGAITTLGGVAVLTIFMIQNTEDVEVEFLWSRPFSWPVWLLTLVAALVGALVWFGLGVLRRHRRRVERAQTEGTEAMTTYPFADTTDFDDAGRGLIGAMVPCVVTADDGRVVCGTTTPARSSTPTDLTAPTPASGAKASASGAHTRRV